MEQEQKSKGAFPRGKNLVRRMEVPRAESRQPAQGRGQGSENKAKRVVESKTEGIIDKEKKAMELLEEIAENNDNTKEGYEEKDKLGEIINAVKGSSNSHIIKKKEELDKIVNAAKGSPNTYSIKKKDKLEEIVNAAKGRAESSTCR